MCVGAANVYLGHGFMCTLQTLRAAAQGLFLSDSVNINKSLLSEISGRQASRAGGQAWRSGLWAGRQAGRLGLQAGCD